MTGTPNSANTPRQQEADLLADIGVALWPQDLRVHVTLPSALADQAAAAWQRDDRDITELETAADRDIRARAGDAALIGLAVVERGNLTPEGKVTVELDAWSVGAALIAADTAGRLDDTPPAATPR